MEQEIQKEKLSISQQVEQMLRKQQERKVFKDSEIRIQGSRKEMAAIAKVKRMSLQELMSLSATELSEYAIESLVKKDKVFPEFNAAEQKEAGVNAGAAYLKQKIRDSYPAKPYISGALAQRIYTGTAQQLYDQLLPLKTIDEVTLYGTKDFLENLAENCCRYAYGQNDEWKGIFAAIFKHFGMAEYSPWQQELEQQPDFTSAYRWHIEYFGKLDILLNEKLKQNYNELENKYNVSIWRGSGPHGINPNINFNDPDAVNILYAQLRTNLPYYAGNISTDMGTLNYIHDLLVFNQGIRAISTVLGKTKSNTGEAYNLMFQYLVGDIGIEEEVKYGKKVYGLNNPISSTKFWQLFFGARFYNILHSHYYGFKAAHETYLQAKEYAGITPEQSAKYMEEVTKYKQPELEKMQRNYTKVADVKFIEEMDKLMAVEDEERIPKFGFYFQHKQPNGRIKLSHAYYEKLIDKDDKWRWIEYWLKYHEKEIPKKISEIEQYTAKHQPRPQDWSWAFSDGSNKAAADSEIQDTGKIRLHDKPILTHIERIGGLRINKKRLAEPELIAQYLKETFGFKAFEYGASLKDAEAREIIYYFLGAVSDLGDILNIDLAAINRQAGLSMGFGSRGGGTAKAKYTSAYRMISITKSSGDGSIAHEYAHFLDNIVPLLDHPHSYNKSQYSTSAEDMDRWKAGKIENPGVALCFLEIMTYITDGKRIQSTGTEGRTILSVAPQLKSTVEYVATAEKGKGRRLLSYMPKAGNTAEELSTYPLRMAAFNSRYTYYEEYNRQMLLVYDVAVKDAGLETFTFNIPSKRSLYYTESAKAGGEYWTRNTELFARAFEVYVFDKLKKANRYNNFLCSGPYEEPADEYRFMYPYPQFEQREYLFVLFEKLITAIKHAYDIGDFVPFTELKNEATITEIAIGAKNQLSLSDKMKRLWELMNKP